MQRLLVTTGNSETDTRVVSGVQQRPLEFVRPVLAHPGSMFYIVAIFVLKNLRLVEDNEHFDNADSLHWCLARLSEQGGCLSYFSVLGQYQST